MIVGDYMELILFIIFVALLYVLNECPIYGPCPKCGGKMKFIGEEPNGIHVYECVDCGQWWV